MARPGNVDHVKIVFLYYSVEMRINKIETRRGTPVPQQPWLDMLFGQGFFEQRVVVEVNLAHRKVVRCPPVSVELFQLVGAERQLAGSGSALLRTLFAFFTRQNRGRHNYLLLLFNTQFLFMRSGT